MYPRIIFDGEKLIQNYKNIENKLKDKKIDLALVTKVICADPNIIKIFEENGAKLFADARLDNILKMKKNGIKGKFMLLRIPMISELEKVIENVDYVLISELKTLKKLGEISSSKNKKIKVIYMIDLGDLREGVWYKTSLNELIRASKVKGITLEGIGTNLGCFGGILPDENNMKEIVLIKNKFEKNTGIKLNLISGGATANLPLVEKNKLPIEINNLRIGEAIFCGTDVTNNRKVPGAVQDAITLEAEIVEIKDKPSIPVGNIGLDAFGRKPTFEDKGIRKKCIIAVGEQDIDPKGLKPKDKSIQVLHSSSDHTILDITNCEKEYDIGDIISFEMSYSCTLKASTSEYVKKIYNKPNK
ncbi:alanine/ornithine racemase family PLP-dependent enzyme [Oceanotoga sp. DSM 15011]|uniref:alanine/ornithine racemase family PLP-dependent enzyme n=1 Tax=Oceanotoga sp. DSM 15011 TaxID=2984951 RepID=UPI0021F46082|nr:alanine/ornithine racemase family PLP-dependent enzyme [Oceanotoga sp. DSM 15011]UYP00089.1 alanine/ornithine racemase family PLP-dependent enzyme [Oceanotoga sp. DSM 15011]